MDMLRTSGLSEVLLPANYNTGYYVLQPLTL